MTIKQRFINNLEKSIKPLRCICGKEYKEGSFEGGFVTNGITYFWCCCSDCAEEIKRKII